MRAYAILKNVIAESDKPIIVRNLNRILDIRILDIDMENGILHFLYFSQKALEHVKNELRRIGYPMKGYSEERTCNPTDKTGSLDSTSIFTRRAHRPYPTIMGRKGEILSGQVLH